MDCSATCFTNRLLKPLNPEQHEKVVSIVKDLVNMSFTTKKEYQKSIQTLSRKYHFLPNTSQVRFVYNELLASGDIEQCESFEDLTKSKAVRENSGVLVFALLMSPYPETGEFEPTFTPITDIESYKYDPKASIDIRKINPVTGEKRQDFTCPFNCHYCPDVPGYSRSYLPLEDSVARGDQNNWDAVLQIRDRAKTYHINGIAQIDKAEIICQGGTYTSYPYNYRIKFMRDIFYAFNTLNDKELRPRLSLSEEIKINETADARVVGLSIETRPDCITKPLIREFRDCGITRIQLGIQHTDDDVLKFVNRQCTTRKAKHAIRMLKDSSFKIQIHLMPDLPGSDPVKDRDMFNTILHDPDLQIDSLKIYPCQVVDYTEIKRWYDEGSYKPYAETTTIDGKNPLTELLIDYKSKGWPWVRNERIVRDIKAQDLRGGLRTTNLRQLIKNEMDKRGLKCRCIRCREVRDAQIDPKNIKLMVREYESSGGQEHFISFESLDESTIYGFCRLRLTPNSGSVIPELQGCAMIRELHVYGKMNAVGTGSQSSSAQHLGLGKRLLRKAEQIAYDNGFRKIAVISGVGVRSYYRKLGYRDGKYYMIKSIERNFISLYLLSFIFVALFVSIFNYYF